VTPLHQSEVYPAYCIEFSERFDGTVTSEYLNASTCLDLPPPITCRHLIVDPVVQLLILIAFLGSKLHPILERWVPNQLAHTVNRIPSPEFNLLDNSVAIFILAVSGDFEDFASPLRAFGEAIDFLEEGVFVLRGWVSAGLNLGWGSTSHIGTANICTYRFQF